MHRQQIGYGLTHRNAPPPPQLEEEGGELEECIERGKEKEEEEMGSE